MVIFRAAMANPVFAQITAEPSACSPSDNGEQLIVNQDELQRTRRDRRQDEPTPLADVRGCAARGAAWGSP